MTAGGAPARADLRGGLGWMLFGLVVLVAAWRMDRFESMGGTIYTAPGLVPALFGGALLLLGAALAARGWRRQRAAGQGRHDATDDLGPLLNRRVVGTLALTLGYAVGLVGRAPFAASTALFVAIFATMYSESGKWPRRLAVGILAGVLTAVAVVWVFEDLFLVRLP